MTDTVLFGNRKNATLILPCYWLMTYTCTLYNVHVVSTETNNKVSESDWIPCFRNIQRTFLNPMKNSSFNRIRTHELCDTWGKLYIECTCIAVMINQCLPLFLHNSQALEMFVEDRYQWKETLSAIQVEMLDTERKCCLSSGRCLC